MQYISFHLGRYHDTRRRLRHSPTHDQWWIQTRLDDNHANDNTGWTEYVEISPALGRRWLAFAHRMMFAA